MREMGHPLLSIAIIVGIFTVILTTQMAMALAVTCLALFLMGKVFHIPETGIADFFREGRKELEEVKMAIRKRHR